MAQAIRVMGILNATPDSFSDGGQYNQVEAAYERAMQLVAEGADILDIGGESTRPGASIVDAPTELERVLPILEALAPTCPVPISIDTYKADVAEAAVRAGASIINDVWGGLKDPRIRQVAAETDAIYIITHNRLEAGRSCSVQDVCQETQLLIDHAKQAGVRDERIWIDPGFGFAKTYNENLRLMHGLGQFCQLGYPVVLGTSRKTFIRKTLGREAHEVLEGSLATAVLGAQQGCAVIRVHDVAETRRALTMTEAIMQADEE